jgi:hypothetical protein
VRIIDNTAPWQLREGDAKGEVLNAALRKARMVIEENVRVLKKA